MVRQHRVPKFIIPQNHIFGSYGFGFQPSLIYSKSGYEKPTHDSDIMTTLLGEQPVIEIPLQFLKLLNNDLKAAIFLAQIVELSAQSPDAEGWFAKSYDEWQRDVFLSRHQIARCTRKLASLQHEGNPLVETMLVRSKDHEFAPTLHYRYNASVLKSLLKEGL